MNFYVLYRKRKKNTDLLVNCYVLKQKWITRKCIPSLLNIHPYTKNFPPGYLGSQHCLTRIPANWTKIFFCNCKVCEVCLYRISANWTSIANQANLAHWPLKAQQYGQHFCENLLCAEVVIRATNNLNLQCGNVASTTGLKGPMSQTGLVSHAGSVCRDPGISTPKHTVLFLRAMINVRIIKAWTLRIIFGMLIVSRPTNKVWNQTTRKNANHKFNWIPLQLVVHSSCIWLVFFPNIITVQK